MYRAKRMGDRRFPCGRPTLASLGGASARTNGAASLDHNKKSSIHKEVTNEEGKRSWEVKPAQLEDEGAWNYSVESLFNVNVHAGDLTLVDSGIFDSLHDFQQLGLARVLLSEPVLHIWEDFVRLCMGLDSVQDERLCNFP